MSPPNITGVALLRTLVTTMASCINGIEEHHHLSMRNEGGFLIARHRLSTDGLVLVTATIHVNNLCKTKSELISDLVIVI